MDLKEIEFWEHEYLEQLYYLLTIDKDKMLHGLDSKEDIRNDWEEYIVGKSQSDIAVGSERIFYWLFNQFGIPNSSPIGSDLFFETYNAYIHIDIKTVQKKNVTSDFARRIIVGKNQNTYEGKILYENKKFKENYHPHLPTYYNKGTSNEKICLSFFIAILNAETEKDIQSIILTCMPNGELAKYYDDGLLESDVNTKTGPLAPGKTGTEARFRYTSFKTFDLLDDKPLRTKVIYWNEEMDKTTLKKLKEVRKIYLEQEK